MDPEATLNVLRDEASEIIRLIDESESEEHIDTGELLEAANTLAGAVQALDLDGRRWTNGLEAIRRKMLNAECVGLDEEGNTCRKGSEWTEHPDKWCHVCSVLWMVDEALKEE